MDLSVRQFLMVGFGARALFGAARRRLAPGDEAASDPSFSRVLAVLRRVVEKRDEAGFRALCAPDVITGVDMTPGPGELLKKMRAGGWAELETALRMGAARYEKGFALPYLFGKFPDDLDSYEHVVTIRAGAVLRAEAADGAKVVCPLDFDILQVKEFKPGAKWMGAARLDGPKGWVAAADVRSLGAPRIFFEKRQGIWKITAWAGGS
jgi:hypothetical protein